MDRAAASTEKCSRRLIRPFSESFSQSSRDRQTRITASAKLAGPSAIIAVCSCSRYIPSAASGVTMTGTPSAML